MKSVRLALLFAVVIGFLTMGTANALPVTVSTGDLGRNVIRNLGGFEVGLEVSTPSNSLPASIDIKYGAWNGNTRVWVFFNNTILGEILANSGYISPGPQYSSFDVTGLLLEGLNLVAFDGFYSNGLGDYVIGQVDLNYDNSGSPVPEPASVVLVGMGLAGLGILRRKSRKADEGRELSV